MIGYEVVEGLVWLVFKVMVFIMLVESLGSIFVVYVGDDWVDEVVFA